MGRSADHWQDEIDHRREAAQDQADYEEWRAKCVVLVYHRNRDDGGFTHVADVDTDGVAGDDLGRLANAFRRTNNVGGSWSRGATLPGGERNDDYSDRVVVRAPLPVHQGVTYGLRSTSVGDIFRLGETWYTVAPLGFGVIAKPDWADNGACPDCGSLNTAKEPARCLTCGFSST